MEIDPQRDRHVREAMEACRPGHDDISDLGLAFLANHLESDPALCREFRRLERLDQSLANAFHDVAVPEGLADRILASLTSETDGRIDQDQEAEAETRSRPAAKEPKFSRRWLFAGAASIAAAVAVLWMVSTQVQRWNSLDASNADQTAIEFFRADMAEEGQLVSEVLPPANYPFAADVQPSPDMRWRWVRGFLGHTAVAYDITTSTGEQGTLYVIHGTATGVPGRLSRQPLLTQGCAASVWQADSCLYVLVVRGGERSYNRFIAPSGPLA